jgi:hypothetical protein
LNKATLNKKGMTEADTEPEPTLASAMDNGAGIEKDMAELGTLVRERFFYIIIHDLKDDSDDVLRTDGRLCNASIQYFLQPANRGKITNKFILSAPETDFKQYLRFMWKEGLSTKGKGNIRRELSQEKSAVYAAINEAFKSKFVLCTSHIKEPIFVLTDLLLRARIGADLCCCGSPLPRI